VLSEFGGAQFSTFKPRWSISGRQARPINAEMNGSSRPAYIDSVLADGSARAQVLRRETMKAVKDIVGFVRR
jgi:tryptophanyl-tRNA synthetase